MFSFQFQYDVAAMVWFAVTVGSLVLLARIVSKPRTLPVQRRLETLATDDKRASAVAPSRPQPALAGPGSAAPPASRRRGQSAETKGGLRERLLQAGLYRPRTYVSFHILRLVGLLAPIAAGYCVGHAGWVAVPRGLLFGTVAGLAGTLAPGLWLDHLKRVRQTKVRRALPDALDVISVCLQGGLSLSTALTHVARELHLAHPALAAELNIIERQIQMGSSAGDAIREMATRFDLDELRSMATVITQAERVGASVATALELFADSMRVKRHQHAEELAHKAAVKLLIPTLLCVFPAIFVVILGPAVLRIYFQVLPGLTGH